MLHVDCQLKQAVIFRRKEGSQLRRFIYPPTHPPNISSSSVDHHLLPINQSIKRERERESLSWIQNLSFGQIHILPLSLYIYILEFLMVDSYSNLSWLVWIQMFVFFLLLLLLCVFGLLSSDISESSVSSSDSLPSTSASGRFLAGDPIPISHHRGLGFSVVQSNQVNS